MSAGTPGPLVVVPDDVNGAYAASPDLARLRAAARVELHGTRPGDEAELARRIRDADVVLSFRPAFTRFTEKVLAACPRLRLVCISGTGVEDVAVAAATARGIAVANVVGAANRAVAEHCLALLFAVARQVTGHDRDVRAGRWQAREGLELGGRTLGLVGLSAIARELAPLARGLGMSVLSWSRDNDPARAAAVGATAVPLERLLAESDVVSVHVRLNPETRGLIGERELRRMKPSAILINTARGEVIDEPALVAALRDGRLRGAGLDVFAREPLPPDDPLLALDNVVVSPVAGWNTADAAARMIGRSIDNVLAFLAGRPANVVNPRALGPARGE